MEQRSSTLGAWYSACCVSCHISDHVVVHDQHVREVDSSLCKYYSARSAEFRCQQAILTLIVLTKRSLFLPIQWESKSAGFSTARPTGCRVQTSLASFDSGGQQLSCSRFHFL